MVGSISEFTPEQTLSVDPQTKHDCKQFLFRGVVSYLNWE